MKLQIKSTKVHEDIVDENDKKIGEVEFDPQDITIYKKYLKLVDIIEEKQKNDKEIGEIEQIPNFSLNNIEDFDKYKDTFKKIDKKLDNYLETIEEIKKITDEIFGNVSEVFSKVSSSIDPYLELIKWANPYFKQGRNDKVNKYLDDAKDVL